MDTDAALVVLFSAAFITIKKSRKKNSKKPRSVWTRRFLTNRNDNLLTELKFDEELFQNFTRMSRKNFENLFIMIEPAISKKDTNYRVAISPQTRLAITLRYLATGDSFMSLSYLFKVSKQSISVIIPNVLKSIIEALDKYIKYSTTEKGWQEISEDFDQRWNFPHCIGAIDGKHVVIQRPENSVAENFNYKGTYSLVLMAIVDANYRFTWVNVGCQGRISDGGVFKNTSFCEKLDGNRLDLPKKKVLPGRKMPIPYFLVADDAFALGQHVMKPYATDLNKGSPKRVFNYRLSRARRIVENAFGLLASVFRVFRKPIEIKVENTIVDLVLACVFLHNYLRSQSDSNRYYSPPGCLDKEDASTGDIIPGTWRQATANDTGLRPLRSIPRNPIREATEIRDELRDYFMSPQGSVQFQNKYL